MYILKQCHLHSVLLCLSTYDWIMLKRRIRAMELRCYRKMMHLIQRPRYQRGCPCQDPAGNWTTRRPPDHRKETQTEVIWTCLPFIRSGQHKTQWRGWDGGGEGWQGRQKKRWEDHTREWTGLEFAKSQRAVDNRKKWRKLVVKSGIDEGEDFASAMRQATRRFTGQFGVDDILDLVSGRPILL